MKKFELIVVLLVLLAIILKLLHITGSGILTVLTFSTLSIFYYLSFALFNGIRLRDIFKNAAYKDTNAKRIIGAIGLGFVLYLTPTASLVDIYYSDNPDYAKFTSKHSLTLIIKN